MPRTQSRYVVRGLAGLVIALAAALACQAPKPSETPAMLAYVDGQTLRFKCLNNARAPRDIDLGAHIESLEGSPVVYSAFYQNSSSVSAVLTFWDMSGAVVNINPQTNQVRHVALPGTIDPRLITMADGRVVVGYMSGKVLVVQEDLSLKEVDLGLKGPRSGIDRLIADRQGHIIGLNWSLIEEGGQTFAEVFIINVGSGEFERKLLRSPNLDRSEPGELPVVGRKYVGWFGVNVSKDLTKLYRLYRIKKDSQTDLVQVLGKFDVASLEELASNADIRCTGPGMAGYSQYHNVLYSSRLPEASGVATLLDMDSLKPIVDLERIRQREGTSRLIVSPFGDGFLLGTSSRVTQVSSDGSVVAEYPAPPDWMTRDYAIVQHRQ